MNCKRITLYQYRNYKQQIFNFNEKIIGICGNNGTGKTNLLDTIYYSCFTKSYFTRQDSQVVTHNKNGMRIDCLIEINDEEYNIKTILRENNRKEIYVNDDQYSRFSKHIGKFPCVMIAPDDVSLINGTGEERRKFIDTILSQLESSYLEALIHYNKVLQQRNSFLKISADKTFVDQDLLNVFDKQLVEKGDFIFNQRKIFLSHFLRNVKDQHKRIAGSDEDISLIYESQLDKNNFKQLLAQNFSRDLYLQRTGIGIHKDELGIYINNIPFKSIASQGQKKTLLFALKLAEFEMLNSKIQISPILLLDDVFEKLDSLRIQQLLTHVCINSNAQVFITDTHKDRLETALIKTAKPYQLIEL